MSSLTFLEAVAQACLSHYDDMSQYCFLFPNKRSTSFFLKSMAENLGDRVLLAPDVMDVAEFMSTISGRRPATRLDSLFRLYNIYVDLISAKPSATEALAADFDHFAPWGEILVNDFSEIDQFDVSAADLFRNVKDFREIEANYLTEEQKEVIERYFGYYPQVDDVEAFWRHTRQGEESEVKRRFIELWELLPALYTGLKQDLEKDSLSLQGTIFREARERVEKEGFDALPWKHIVVVGFNMLSTTEARIFDLLKGMTDEQGMSVADFFWDATGPILSAESNVSNPATISLQRNMQHFPMPEWGREFVEQSNVSEMPKSMTIAASPSNVAQTKIAALTIREWMDKVDRQVIDAANVAVVVPDESLLMPLLYSLPDELESVNLTMGYSMRYTSIASFIYHLRRLHSRRRKLKGGTFGYYFDDFSVLITHPLVQSVIGSDAANMINSDIAERHLRFVSVEDVRMPEDGKGVKDPEAIKKRNEQLDTLFRPLPEKASFDDVVDYINRVLTLIYDSLGMSNAALAVVNANIEQLQIERYRMALNRLSQCVHQYKVNILPDNVFYMIDRLIAGEKINFEGEPLKGLQIMGLLETRALDFKHLIILSMNDKVMPRASSRRTFIPETLRRGYGLPLSSRAEELYAYYFYRLISRAEDVTLIYDARVGDGMRSGGKSRFLLQLDLLYAQGYAMHRNYVFNTSHRASNSDEVVKNVNVMKRLEQFKKKGSGANLSASALMDYCACPVKFYYKDVVKLSDETPVSSDIDAITQGNIVHRTILNLYIPEGKQNKYLKSSERVVLEKEDFESILNDPNRISDEVRQSVNIEHFHLKGEDVDRPLTGKTQMVADRLALHVRDVVRYDMENSPVELVGCEIKGITRWKVDLPEDETRYVDEVNIRYALDRVDIIDGVLRVVDYKTGSANVNAENGLVDVFNGSNDSKYLLQLLVYAHLLEGLMHEKGESIAGRNIAMKLYDVHKIATDGPNTPTIGKMVINGFREESVVVNTEEESGDPDSVPLYEGFRQQLNQIINEIFNPDIPFTARPDAENACRYCHLSYLCGRE
ncbi:MAG: PD-(D/E)XK nuclease family protein [Lepagella sp.]